MPVNIWNKSLALVLTLTFLSATCCNSPGGKGKPGNAETGNNKAGYYIDNEMGVDSNPGTIEKPLKTIKELNIRLGKKAADVIFKAGSEYTGTLLLKDVNRLNYNPIKIYSYGPGKAVINGLDSEAIKIENCVNILISDLEITGAGRKTGNKTNGLSLVNSKDCLIENIYSHGFQKSGVDLFNCAGSVVSNVIAADNGFSGINVMGSARNLSRKILIQGCKAENNPGDPSNLENHSGNGILVGISDSVTIDHCSATNNGWDMPRQGNGPVGIWTWESDHVLIQYCISYRNKTSRNAKDGGGFDLDGGVTNSVIQNCLSYENMGAGYGLFQYSGASKWSHNTIRYCVSINDAWTTEGAGSIFIWNGSKDVSQLTDCMIYNNVMYNVKAPVVSFEQASDHTNFIFSNNIFLGTDQPLSGINTGSIFAGNDWWNPSGTTKFMNFKSMAEWAYQNKQEEIQGHFAGLQVDPMFKGPLLTSLTDPYQLEKLTGYILSDESSLKGKGMDLNSIFGIDQPQKDFFGNTVSGGHGTEPGIYEMK